MANSNKFGMTDKQLSDRWAVRRAKRKPREVDQGLNELFDRVSSGELSPEEGAKELKKLRG